MVKTVQFATNEFKIVRVYSFRIVESICSCVDIKLLNEWLEFKWGRKLFCFDLFVTVAVCCPNWANFYVTNFNLFHLSSCTFCDTFLPTDFYWLQMFFFLFTNAMRITLTISNCLFNHFNKYYTPKSVWQIWHHRCGAGNLDGSGLDNEEIAVDGDQEGRERGEKDKSCLMLKIE